MYFVAKHDQYFFDFSMYEAFFLQKCFPPVFNGLLHLWIFALKYILCDISLMMDENLERENFMHLN